MNKIAVIGAGGATGLECVRRLDDLGKFVRCVVPDPKKCASEFESFDAEVIRGSVTDEQSMHEALRGMRGVIYVATSTEHGSPEEVDYLGVANAARAAKNNGIQHFALLSCHRVNPKSRKFRLPRNKERDQVLKYKFEGEMALRKEDLQHYVVVRAGALVGGRGQAEKKKPGIEHLLLASTTEQLGSVYSIHRADVAAVLCKALADPYAKQKTIEIGTRPAFQDEPTIEEQLAPQVLFASILQDPPASEYETFAGANQDESLLSPSPTANAAITEQEIMDWYSGSDKNIKVDTSLENRDTFPMLSALELHRFRDSTFERLTPCVFASTSVILAVMGLRKFRRLLELARHA